jgi:signal transduction histidine kinase
VAAAAVVLFALPLAIVLQRSYRDEELFKLQRDTIAATREIDLTTPGDPPEIPRNGGQLTLYDRSGDRIRGDGPGRAGSLVRSVLRSGRVSTASGTGRLVAVVPLVSNERIAGAVLARRSDAAVRDREREAVLTLAAIALAVLAAALGAAVFLARRLAQPLERLGDAATRLGEGNFATRAPRAGIPEVDSVAAALDTTAARLNDLVTRERSFSADASHQLRTPLAALRLDLESLQLHDGDAAPELTAALGQVDRLQTTIDTLLAVARDAPRSRESTDVRQLVDAADRRWRGPLADASRPLSVQVPPATPVATTAAPEVIREILDVLLANAEAHGSGAVTVTASQVEGWPVIDVHDEGPGFEDPDAAFARRSGDTRRHGIGLALARALATAEGGRLRLLVPGPGPTLRLMLPPARDQPD